MDNFVFLSNAKCSYGSNCQNRKIQGPTKSTKPNKSNKSDRSSKSKLSNGMIKDIGSKQNVCNFQFIANADLTNTGINWYMLHQHDQTNTVQTKQNDNNKLKILTNVGIQKKVNQKERTKRINRIKQTDRTKQNVVIDKGLKLDAILDKINKKSTNDANKFVFISSFMPRVPRISCNKTKYVNANIKDGKTINIKQIVQTINIDQVDQTINIDQIVDQAINTDIKEKVIGTIDIICPIQNRDIQTTDNKIVIDHNKRTLIVVDVVNSEHVMTHTNILVKEFKADIIDCDFLQTIDTAIYDNIIWQNTKDISTKLVHKSCNQKYIYVIHNTDTIPNKYYDVIDIYVFASDIVHNTVFSINQNVNCYDKEYTINTITDTQIQEYIVFVSKYADLLGINNILSEKIAIVTSTHDLSDDNIKKADTNNIDCYCFSQNNDQIYEYAKGLTTNDKLFDAKIIQIMRDKYYKVNHHKIDSLNKYRYTIWLDEKVRIKNVHLLKWYVYDMYLKDIKLAFHADSKYNAMFDDVMSDVNDDTNDMIGQYVSYVNSGYREKGLYAECRLIIRDNHDVKINAFFNNWWNEILTKTYQDQISFCYLLNKHDINYSIIGYDIYDSKYVSITSDTIDSNITPQVYSVTDNDKVNSYDLWDTIIGRISYDSKTLFSIIERRLNIPNFTKLRLIAEKDVTKTKNKYNLNAIYDLLYPVLMRNAGKQIVSNMTKEQLCNYELALETDLTFVIYENRNKLENNMIIVADYYYTSEQVQKLLRINKIYMSDIYISNNGKFDGWIWNDLKRKYKIINHTGDNRYCDYYYPKKYSIPTTWYEGHKINQYEQFLIDNKYDLLAYVMRAVRLSNNYVTNTIEYNMWNFYCNRYLPIIFVQVLVLKMLFPNIENEKVCFIDGSCYVLMHIFKSVFDNNKIQYMYVSQNAMKYANEEYVSYVKAAITDAIVVDLLDNSDSFTAFCRQYGLSYKKYVVLFMGKSNEDIIQYDNDKNIIGVVNYFNKYIERLNYSWHGSFCEFDRTDMICQEFDYDTKLVHVYFKLISITSKYITKIKDIIKEYDITVGMVYKIIYFVFGQRDSIFELDVIDMLEMIRYNDIRNIDDLNGSDKLNTLVRHVNQKGYFLDINEYFDFVA